MKLIGEILTAEQIADLARLMPKAGNAILEMTEDQLDFLKGYIKSCKILNQSTRTEKMLAKAKSNAETRQRHYEDQIPMWISAANPPENWRMDDEEMTIINYLVVVHGYGVDIGNYFKPANKWFVMGMPANVSYWMTLPEPPEVERNE